MQPQYSLGQFVLEREALLALEDLGGIFVDWSSFCLCKNISQSGTFASVAVGTRQRSLTERGTVKRVSCAVARTLLPEGKEAGGKGWED